MTPQPHVRRYLETNPSFTQRLLEVLHVAGEGHAGSLAPQVPVTLVPLPVPSVPFSMQSGTSAQRMFLSQSLSFLQLSGSHASPQW
jgi:hypothetical protein